MLSNAAQEQVRRLLEGKSERQVREVCIEALRRWYRGEAQGAPGERRIVSTPLGHPQPDDSRSRAWVQMHGDLGVLVLRIHSAETGEPVVADAKEVFLEGQTLPFMAPVMDFVWWLVRAGLARPELGRHILGGFDMTAAGLKFLASGTDHPLAPEFLARLRSRCPDIPESAFVLFEDAQSCLEFRLLRPAVVLLGVAYETMVEAVLLHFVARALTAEKSIRAAPASDRVSMLKKLMAKLEFNKEDLRMATAAVDFADHLRVRRNDGSHTTPRWPFDDTDEVEELLLSAARHLPILWAITKASPRTEAG